MKFAREGLPVVYVLGAVTIALGLMGWWWAGFAVLVLTFAVAAFFRDPERAVPGDEKLIVSPADGRVVAVDDEKRAEGVPDQTFRRVSVFMSPLNVHVNRAPVSGKVVSVRHTPGKFLAAFSDRAPFENERNEVVLRDLAGRLVVFTQIAGLLARRIVCHLEPGATVEQGSRFGLIMFGSRVDVYLPRTAVVRVVVGSRVRAGVDVLGEHAS